MLIINRPHIRFYPYAVLLLADIRVHIADSQSRVAPTKDGLPFILFQTMNSKCRLAELPRSWINKYFQAGVKFVPLPNRHFVNLGA